MNKFTTLTAIALTSLATLAIGQQSPQAADPANQGNSSVQSESAPLTKSQLKDQKKQQKHQEKAAKEAAKAQKAQADALKHQDQAKDEQEKAQQTNSPK